MHAMKPSIDILMVTYQAPESTRMALDGLLDTCDESMRVWLWHNGDHEETLEVVRGFAKHPCVHRFHHSRENVRLWAPTNWLFEEATGDYLSKIDDDNVVPKGWIKPLLQAHADFDKFGVLGCWRFQEEDFIPELAAAKIREFPGGHRLMLNFWVEGSCFLMKRRCREDLGPLKQGQTLPSYFKSLALRGWVNGWYYPFIRYDNLDDPRCARALVRTQADFEARLPLTAQFNGVSSIDEWVEQLRRSARVAQTASIDPRYWGFWPQKMRSLRFRIESLFGRKHKW